MNRLTGLDIFLFSHKEKHKIARNEAPHIMKAIIFSCQSWWERGGGGKPKLIGRKRGAEKKKVGDWVRSSLSLPILQLLTGSWEYEMRLRNEKYSYHLWMVLNPDREKENEWWFQFLPCIKSDKILNWSQITDCLHHCQDKIGCSHFGS